MKTLIFASVLGAAAIGAAAQPVDQQMSQQNSPQMFQQAPQDDSTVTITAKGPTIDLPERVRAMPASEFALFTGSYELENGDSVALFSRGLKKYAKLHNGAWHEVVAASDRSFVSRDRMLKVTFVADEEGRLVGGDVLMAVPDERTAKLHGRKHQTPHMKLQDVAMR
jgi:hypothetical protein